MAVVYVHERQLVDQKKLSPQPQYTLNRSERCNIKWTYNPNPERWKSINCYKKQINFRDDSFTVSKSCLLREAKRMCPHLDVPAILSRYCEQTKCLPQTMPQPRCSPSHSSGHLTKHSSETGRSSGAAKELTLVCRIPIWRDGNNLKVSLPTVKTLPWTHVYAPLKAQDMMSNSVQCQILKEWLLCWPQTTPGLPTSKSTARNNITNRRRSFLRKLAQDVEWKENGHLPELDNNSSDEEEQETEQVQKFPVVTLLHGRHGSGKTAAVYACAAEAGLEVFEINTSAVRNRTQLVKKLREVFRSCQVRPAMASCFKRSPHAQLTVSQSSVILVDEIDVVLEEDTGFLQALQEVVADSNRPVVVTCNDHPVKFSMHTLNCHFDPPSEMELGVHLSLLSVAHDKEMALPLPVTFDWSRHFNCDIRKALLHLQFSLATPSQPPLLPPDGLMQYQATPSCAPPTTPPVIAAQRPPLVPIATPTQCPWKIKACDVNKTGHHGDMGVVTELECMAHQTDYKSCLDCMRSGMATVARGNDVWMPQQPYRARLLPGLMDKHSHLVQEDASSLNLSRQILQEMESRHSLLDGRQEQDNDIHSSTSAQLQYNAATTLLSSQCALYRKEVMSEILPYLKFMYLQETSNRKSTGKRRCPRHYFHSQQQELQHFFSI